jgi:citrate synthase
MSLAPVAPAPVAPVATHAARTPPAPRAPWSSGLEDVVVAGTDLSVVDADGGALFIAGRALDAIDDAFIDVAAALDAHARAAVVDDAYVDRFAAARGAAFAAATDRPVCGDPMAHLAGLLAGLDVGIAGVDDDAAALVGVVHGVVGAAHRVLSGRRARRAPDARLGAGAWLAAACADVDDDRAGAALDRYLVTVVDHGMNASTFAARVAASTRASLRLALVAGVATLAGPLHGGAPGPVLDLFDAVDARGLGVVADELAAGRRLMGFGHRVYRARDPRAAVLERATRALVDGAPPERRRRLDLAHQLEAEALRLLRAAHPERPLAANVEFFTALLLDAIGIDRRAFALVFACGRAAGWAAHVVEQRRVGKLIRPRSVAV